MAKKETLRELLIMKIRSLYDIENELVKALPKMAEAATDPALKEAFQDHLGETEFHVKRLEDVFDLLGEEKERLEGEAIRGLVKDGERLAKDVAGGDALDTALVAAGRGVEHFEMSAYMAAQEWAEMYGDEGVSALLEETFEEEERAEEKLADLGTAVAERMSGDGDEEEV